MNAEQLSRVGEKLVVNANMKVSHLAGFRS